jgi:hypothetical protein
MRALVAFLTVTSVLACSNSAVLAEWSLSESFDGSFDQSWGDAPAFPTVGRVSSLTYVGLPDFTFETVDGAQVLHLTNLMEPHSRCGMVSSLTLAGSTGEVEARVNTLVQDSQTIDGLFELWLVNPEDFDKYVAIVFHSGSYSQQRMVICFSSEEAMYEEELGYENNTWYLLRITATPTILRLSVWDDTGTTALFAHDMGHTLAALGDGFMIGIAQHMDSPDGAYTADSAVDYVEAREDYVSTGSRTWSDVKALFRR